MSYSRLNPRQSIFFKTACDFAKKSLEKLDNYKTYVKNDNRDLEYYELDSIVNNNACYSLIFLCLGIEAFIYDFGARFLGDNYVKMYLDKLDVISKIVIYPRLVTGQEIDRDKKYFGDIKKLIKIRNEFVHSKSKDFIPDNINEKDISDFIDRIDLLTCFKSTIELITEIYSLINDTNEKYIMKIELKDLKEFIKNN